MGTDMSLIARTLSQHEIEGNDGQPISSTDANGFTTYALLYDDVRPGMTSAEAYQTIMGRAVDHFNADYEAALKAMRQEYRSRCGGDQGEIRSTDDLIGYLAP